MAAKKTNSLELNSKTLTELFKNRGEMSNPSWSVGDVGIKSTTGGKQTVSQEKNKYLANIDWKKRTPLQNYLEFGSSGITGSGEEVGREEQKKAIARIKQFAGEDKVKIPTKKVDSAEEKTPDKSGFLYRVMYAGKGEEESRVFESQKEADEALKSAGGKGAVARIALGYKPSEKKAKVFNDKYVIGELGEPLPAEEQAARKKAYLDTFYKTQADKRRSNLRNAQLKEKIKEVRKPEYKAAVQERSKLANEAKRKRDYEDGAGFRSFKANVKARRESEGVLNDYNSQLGLLRSAYNQARQAGQPLTALKIQRSIQRYQEGVPKEMGERQKFAESGMLKERNDMLAKKLQEAEEAEEEERKKRKLAAANSDARDY